MKYFVGGVNGVGKTSFLDTLKIKKADYEIIDGSRAFLGWLGFGDDYEKLRRLHDSIRDARLAEFINQLISKSKSETLVFAGHYLSLVRGEIGYIVRDWLAKFDGIVLMTATPEIIYERISKDSRDRALFKEGTTKEEAIKTLKDYIVKENVDFLASAEKFGVPKLLINNTDGDIDRIVAEFIDFDARLRRSYL